MIKSLNYSSLALDTSECHEPVRDIRSAARAVKRGGQQAVNGQASLLLTTLRVKRRRGLVLDVKTRHHAGQMFGEELVCEGMSREDEEMVCEGMAGILARADTRGGAL